MPQKPLDASDETVRLTLRLTKSQTHGLDKVRGSESRSEYLRGLLDHALEQLPTVDEPRLMKIVPDTQKHRHRFVRGDEAGYVRGSKVYLYTCECGDTEVR